MKEILSRLLDALLPYGRQMTALLLSPKRAILQLDLESDSALSAAFVFLAVTCTLAFLAQIPLLPAENDKELLFGFLAVSSALVFALNVAAVILVFRVVGAKVAGTKIVVMSCYISGVSTFIFLVFNLISAGTLKILDPVDFRQVISGSNPNPTSGESMIYLALLGLGLVATCAWIFCIWGAYRELMQLSRLRSGIALSLFLGFFFPLLLGVQNLVGVLIMPDRPPAVPQELVGTWQSIAEGTDTRYMLTYEFSAPELGMLATGTYFRIENKGTRVENKGSVGGWCIIIVQQSEFGQLVAHGSTLELTPKGASMSAEDHCTGSKRESKQQLVKKVYEYKLDRTQAPWKLCLSDRVGKYCLNAEPNDAPGLPAR